MTTGESTATFSPSPTAPFHYSPWHSPIPYLSGGLAAMFSLIAIALLMLACSYRRPSSEGDVESGAAEKGGGGSDAEASPIFDEKFLVIMAGEVKPTFLATPVTGKGSPVEDGGETEEFRDNGRQ